MTTNTSSDGPVVLMCCKPDALYPDRTICYREGYFPAEEIVFPEIYHLNLAISTMSPSEFVRVYEFNCNYIVHYLNSVPVKSIVYNLTENGELYANMTQVKSAIYHLRLQDYCITSCLSQNVTVGGAFLCKPFFNTPFLMAESVSVLVEMSLSIPFLAATFLVYTILPALKNVHGFNLRAYVACLFVTYISFVVSRTNDNIFCNYFMVLGLYFWILASYFWLNVMCFDIWWTFRRFRSLQGSSKQEYRKKILIYSIYAWGSAALITGISAIIDFLSTESMGLIKPGLKDDYCWFSTTAAVTIYLYGPMVVTTLANICFFTSTAITIIRHEKDTAHRLSESAEQRHKAGKKKFKLYLKLFMVMRITWIVELIPGLLTLPAYIRHILYLQNTLQGISIFIIFVWKKKIKMLLLKRLGCADRPTVSTLTELSNANS